MQTHTRMLWQWNKLLLPMNAIIPNEEQVTTNYQNNNSADSNHQQQQHRRRKTRSSRSSPKIPNSSSGQPTSLGLCFQPGQYDCICGRGKVAYNHVGNKWLRSIINTYKHEYEQAYDSKIQRSVVVTKILHIVRSNGTGFVKQERTTGEWIEIGDVLAREKIGQQLRESLGGKYKSSHCAKKGRRRSSTSIATQTSMEYVVHSNRDISATIAKMTQQSSSYCSASLNRRLPSSTSDEELIQIFNQGNCHILDVLKQDATLLQRFQEASSIEEGCMDSSLDKDMSPSSSTATVFVPVSKEMSSWAIHEQNDGRHYQVESCHDQYYSDNNLPPTCDTMYYD